MLGVQFKPQSCREKICAPFDPVSQFIFLIVEKTEIVAIADISARVQSLLYEAVEGIEIKVGQPLTGEVADRQPAPPFKWRKQIVAFEPGRNTFLRIAVVDDRFGQSADGFVFYDPAQNRFQNRVIDAGEEFLHVPLQCERAPANHLLRAIRRRVSPFSLSARKTMRMKMRVQNRFEHVHQRVMNHPVAIRRC